MNRERPPPDPERLFATDIASRGHFCRLNCRKAHLFRGVAPYHPFSPSTAPRDWERCYKGSRHKRLGFCLGATNIGLNLQQPPSESVSYLLHDYSVTGGSIWPQFKPSKSMPVSRVEYQEVFSLGPPFHAACSGSSSLCCSAPVGFSRRRSQLVPILRWALL